jgi:hypothetical protein
MLIKPNVTGPRLLKGTVIALLASVALVGIGFIASGLYFKASAELSQLRIGKSAPRHAVKLEPSLAPADLTTAARLGFSI